MYRHIHTNEKVFTVSFEEEPDRRDKQIEDGLKLLHDAIEVDMKQRGIVEFPEIVPTPPTAEFPSLPLRSKTLPHVRCLRAWNPRGGFLVRLDVTAKFKRSLA